MMTVSLPKIRQMAIIGLGIGLMASPGLAGNGPYDPEKKTFSLTYIYLDLPSLGRGQALTSNSEGEVKLARSTTKPNDADKANISRFWNLVSDRLNQVTGNRGALGLITEVNDVEKADAVISLTGNVKPAGYGGAWAQPGGWCKGGTLNIYYQDLLNDDTEDVVETVVHELCHYLFGLPDEYQAGSAPGLLCPFNASKGCLMDNYHQGWYGRLCNRDDHNAAAPGANGFPAITDVKLSCQEIVDNFFADFKVGAGMPIVASVASVPRATLKVPSATRNRVLAKARTSLLTRIGQIGGVVTAELRKEVTKLIATELFNAKVGGLDQVVPKLVEDAIFTAIGAPPILKPIADILEKKAAELAKQIHDPNGKALAIETALFNTINAETGAGKKLGAAPTLGENEKGYIKTLARRAAEGSSLNSDIVVQERRLKERLTTLSTVIIEPPILEIDPTKSPDLGIDQVLTQGDEKADYNKLRMLNGSIFAHLVDRSKFSALSATSAADDATTIDVGLAPLDSSANKRVFKIDTEESAPASVNGTIDGNMANALFDKRKARLDQILALVKDQIDQDKIANIVILIPPGGLTNHFDDNLEKLATAFIGKAELRLDIAVVGSSPVPPRLRDFVTRTNGSILTVTDSDEVGAVAQRLAGEQTQGTWISIPQQDMLTFSGYPEKPPESGVTPVAPVPAGEVTVPPPGVAPTPVPPTSCPSPIPPQEANIAEARPAPSPDFPALYERLAKNRKPHAIASKGISRVVLRPFYLDTSTDYEMIFGMTQDLTVPGVSSFTLDNGTTAPLRDMPGSSFKAPTMHLMEGEIRDTAIAAFESSKDIPTYSWTPNLKLKPSRSTSKTLVFSLEAGSLGGVGAGWYTPVLEFDDNNFRTPHADPGRIIPSADLISYREKKIHFTFSVGTPTTTGQLVANLVQDIPNTPKVRDHGTIDPKASKVVVTAVLSAGAGIIDAEVRGFLQKIDAGGRTDIMTFPIPFNDDGMGDDKIADDGIYTAVISLETPRSVSAEYRLFLDGRSIRGKSRFVPVGEPLLPDPDDKSDTKTPTPPANPTAPVFQRATSINFYVPASNPG